MISMFYLIVLPLGSFLLLLFVINSTIRRVFPKFRNIALRLKLMTLIGLSHFILVLIPCANLAIRSDMGHDAIMGFFSYRIIDYFFWPFYIWLLNALTPALSWNISNIIAPFIAFGIFGSLSYCCLGWLIGFFIEKSKAK